MILSRIQIKNSPIHGLGAFITSDEKEGVVLPDNLPDEAYHLRHYSQAKDNMSAMRLDYQLFLVHDFGHGASWQDYLNHSNNTNAFYNIDGELELSCPVSKGEELTLNYYDSGFDINYKPYPPGK